MAAEPNSFPVVGIGASAGGLEALKDVLRFLPGDTGMAYVLVQHLDPHYESLLSDLLARATAMPVHEAQAGMAVEANHVYVIAPNTDMTLAQNVLHLTSRTEVDGQHLSIDTFLRSLAQNRGTQAIGGVLSGMATDGTFGLQAIKAEGGMTFAQDPSTAQFDGMPHSAIATGGVDFIGSPEAIARELTRIGRHPYVRHSPAVETEAQSEATHPGQEVSQQEPEFQQILRVLRQKTTTDFTAYKPAMLTRRLERRMALLQTDSLAEYLAYLSDHQAEVDALYQDVLIGVTSFFRDATTFQTLRREIWPRILATHAAGSPLRMWVPGCSTGEEVYSLAINVLEFLTENALPVPSISLFGTDLNPRAIEYARTGLYPAGTLSAFSAARLDTFFLRVNGSYQIRKDIRDLCVFARHNLLKDPPFSRLNLLSCQNVLIYLGPKAQRSVFQSFHYALSSQGVLLLGPSETIGSASDLFSPLEEHKGQLYLKKASSARPLVIRETRRGDRGPAPDAGEEEKSMARHEEDHHAFDLQQEVERLLARFAPASVVIDAQMDILHFRGDTSPYLRPAPGRASLNLFKMARGGLDLELRTALSQARKSASPVKKEGVQVSDQGVIRDITIEVLPLNGSATERYFVILFEESSISPGAAVSADGQHEDTDTDTARRGSKDWRIRDVERELEDTRQQMRSVVKEFEAANEELHSANEEMLSSNEELQSLNEELETSKEEIQAGNEELLVVNAELQQRNRQLQDARHFSDAIVETIREPLLILDDDLHVQRANQAFYQHFQVEPANTEGRRIFELGDGQWNIPALRTLLEELLPTNHALVEYEVEHSFPRIGQRVMLLNAHRIDHVQRILLAMEDITLRKQAEREKQQMLEQREEFMAVASHELKTPVTSLKGYTEMLHARFTKVGDEHAASLLAKMKTQLDKLITLISELLDVTSIEAGQLVWHNEPFDLDALVRDLVEEMRYTTQRYQIRIEGTLQIPVSGDRERIRQVFINLLSNAIKYSPQADAVLVTVAADADAAVVGVRDFGIGIAPEQLEHVFERFFRVSDPQSKTFPGLGLGLYIAAQIVTRHGGRMWVESQEGLGSTFFLTLPLPPLHPLQPTPEPGTGRKEGAEPYA
jgi:two-component system CheB/CheR fusion protein